MLVSTALNIALLLASAALGAQITTTTRQTINGIGASGAWWPNDLALFPSEVRQNISQLLLNQTSGLGLTDYRYNLGGGGVGVGTFARAPETPYVSDGVYNFSADPQGTFFLREAARQGVPLITLFVNSAPTTFTTNGQNCGGNLITSRIPEYAQYLADVISYWKTQGVEITHVSPMNEPDSTFGSGDPNTLCGQEGMEVTPAQRAEVVTTLAAALKDAGLSTRVIADESSSTGNFENDAPVWLGSSGVGEALAGIAHHQYGFASGPTQQAMAELGRNLSGGVSTWFTEICCYVQVDSSEADDPLATLTYGGQYDPTMVSALRMANLIFQSFTFAEDEHWDWWTALSSELGSCSPSSDASCVNAVNPDGWDDGLLYYDPNYASTGFYGLGVSKRYSVLRHFTKAAPVGAVRRNVSLSASESAWLVLAFDTDPACAPFATCSAAPFSVVAANAQGGAATLTLTSALSQPTAAFRTSPTEDWAEVAAPTLAADGSLVIEAPGLSVYTLFF
ncbi:glycoside hydrolase [Punctularia strigosozonata HHB-11173 SS5]|uniref:glycoside hydrolase n=1 Tax=Punctularia strigosozonata (strain HHB-11173) TaxID=741275 RepID=UPI0004417227|nr:glycoside hydrolase [Punctularia strigosozonata HHB-11173 SS5]EIN11177.1 glycoside hydrolase [Punctularia strigosozonata HHB-11173 SS5]